MLCVSYAKVKILYLYPLYGYERMNVKLPILSQTLLGFVWLCICTQLVQAQPLTPGDSAFSVLVYSDGFTSDRGEWPTITTQENYFVVDTGSYFVNHTHPTTPYALLKKSGLPKRAVLVGTRVKMGPSDSKDASMGLLLFGSTDENSALVFEINGKKRFRVTQLAQGLPTYLTDGPDGWVKDAIAPETGEWAWLQVWSTARQTRFFLDEQLVFECLECGTSGLETGLFLGPQTVARVDSLWIKSTPPTAEEVRIQQLERELKEVKTSRDQMRRELELTMDERVSQLQGAIAVIEEQLIETTAEAERLRVEVETFSELRALLGDVNRDAVLTLAEALKTELAENAQLSESLKNLQTEIDSLKAERHIWQNELLDALLERDTTNTQSDVHNR